MACAVGRRPTSLRIIINGTMTTPPSASAAATTSASIPSDQHRNISSRSSDRVPAASRGTGPVDLDETQYSLDDSSAGDASQVAEGSSHERNGSVPKGLSPQISGDVLGASNKILSGAGAPGSSDDVNLFMQNLLEDMVSQNRVCFITEE